MPINETPVFIRDEDVIRAFDARQISMSKRVLTDWRQRGYLPPLISTGRGRGEGRNYYWEDASVIKRALLVDEILDAGFRRDGVKLVLWLSGYEVPITTVRSVLRRNVLALQRQLTGKSKSAGEIEDHISHFIYQYNDFVEKHPQLNLPTYEDTDALEVILNIFANPGYDLETAPLDKLSNDNEAPRSAIDEASSLPPHWEFVRKHFALEKLKAAISLSPESAFREAQKDFVLISKLFNKITESSPAAKTLSPMRLNATYTFGSIIAVADLCLRRSEWALKVDMYLPMASYYIDRGLKLMNPDSSRAKTESGFPNDMVTARALQEIDDADFEKLVTLYLRHRDSALAGVIRTGVNEFEKPIKCPVDGIVYMAGPPPQCVAIATTTAEHRELRRKWFGGKKGNYQEPGDIRKAQKEFADWKQRHSQQIRKLFLATNRYLKNDTQLYRDAIARGLKCGIDIEVIEASQLVDFLDYHPEGQFLRRIFFQISAGRLSESLLRLIANKSLAHHARKFSGFVSPQHEISREALQSLLQTTISAQNNSLIALRGESGSGKSTLVRQLAQQVLSNGGLSVWLPAEEILSHGSLASTFHSLLLRNEPSLEADAGNKLLEFSSRAKGGLVVIVDDINRLPAPERALEALQVLATESRQIKAPISFIVPIWKHQLREPSSIGEGTDGVWSIIELGQFSQTEQQEFVETFPSDGAGTFRSIADLMGGDPFLCGLTLPMLGSGVLAENFIDVVKQTFEKVLRKAAEAAVNFRRIDATAAEFASVLDDFIELCVNLDDPEPPWNAVREQLSERKSRLLYLLSETNQIIRISQINSIEHVTWKHDRLRDGFVGRWLAKCVLTKLHGSEVEKYGCVLNPALAEAWAMAFIFAPDDLRTKTIVLLSIQQPLSLVGLLKTRAGGLSEYRKRVVSELKRFLHTASFPDPVGDRKSDLLWALSKTDNDDVLEVTDGLQRRSWHTSAARFRNGDVDAGLDLMSRFFPEDNFKDLEECVDAFAKRRFSERAQVVAELDKAGHDSDSTARLLVLAGYLGWTELVSISWDRWKSLSHALQLSLLPHVVWMLNRCGDGQSQSLLVQALQMAQEIGENEPDAQSRSNLGRDFIRPVERSFKMLMTPAAAHTWAALARTQPQLRNSVAYMLRHIDYPIALETYVRMVAHDEDRLFDAFEHAETNSLDGSSMFRSSIPRRDETRRMLWIIITTDDDQDVRKWAFRFYKRSPHQKDLIDLQRIPQDDPLFDDVVRLRLKLRDETAAEAYVRRIYEAPAKWCHWVHFLYSTPGVSEAFLENVHIALQDEIAYVYLENLPKVMSVDGVHRLVTEKGELLKKYPRMWPALWGVGTAVTLAYVQDCIRQASPAELEHFFLMEVGTRMRSQSQFDALLPVLDKFPQTELTFLADIAVNSGYASWARANLKSRLNSERAGYWFTEDDAIRILNDAADSVREGKEPIQRNPSLYQLDHERRNTFDIRKIVRDWLGRTPTPEQLIVGAIVIMQAGTGNDAAWWNSVSVPANSSIASRVWTNTGYFLQRRRWQKCS